MGNEDQMQARTDNNAKKKQQLPVLKDKRLDQTESPTKKKRKKQRRRTSGQQTWTTDNGWKDKQNTTSVHTHNYLHTFVHILNA